MPTPIEFDEENDRTEVPAAISADSAATSRSYRPHPGRRRLITTAGIALLAGLGIGVGITLLLKSRALSDTADLLALKSEAEGLAISGNLEAAHAKYRELQQHAVGKVIKDALFFDVMERAQIDQDRIYTLLLDKAQAANPPERAIPKPGTGTVTRADDPWLWPRVGNGGRAEPTTAAVEQSTTESAGDVAQSTAVPDSTPSPLNPVQAPPATQEVSEAVEARAQPTTPASLPQASNSTDAKPAPPTPPRWVTDDMITDEEIGYALKRGVDYLLSQFKDGQIAPIEGMTGVKYAGRNALAIYALLQAGRALRDPRLDPRGEFMGRVVDRMKELPLERADKDPAQPIVYARSIRAAALAVYNRKQDRDVLKEDADWLIKAQVNGAYTYDDSLANIAQLQAAAQPCSCDACVASRLERGSQDATQDFGELSRTVSQLQEWRSGVCDGVHDRFGRELGRMKRPNIKPLPRTMPPNNPRRTNRPGIPQGRTNPGDFMPPTNRRVLPPMDARGDGTDPPQFPWDNSNSQYGLLGVWAAAEVGIEVPRKYWEAVQGHWERWQYKDGQWGYMASDREGYLAMTCGGVASLWVTYDWLVAPKSKAQVGRETMTNNLQAGMKWLEAADNAVTTPVPGKTHYPGYDLFGLERVGLASGFKYFGSHDWYRVLATKSLAAQLPSGAWGREDGHPDGLIETAYQLLFLSHGRHPIFMNKLRFKSSKGEKLDGKPIPGYWSNRPRDIANLTRFANRELEQPFNWQVVDLEREWHDWLDCPILYIASHNPPAMGDAEYAKLRQFVEAGGLIFTHADGGSPGFTRWVLEELISKALPGRKTELLPENHPIYSINYNLKKPRPVLNAVSNGSRLLLVHSPTDLAAAWQQRADRTQTPLFQLGVHLFLYAAGKSDFRNRIDSPYVPPAPEATEGSVAVARVKYNGDWDPEPGAWRRFANLYQWEMNINVPVSETEFKSLDAKKTPVAHLTGTRAAQFSGVEVTALRNYVNAGGIILIDPCGGSKEFDASVQEALLAKAFPKIVPQPVPPSHPVLGGNTEGAEPMTLQLRASAPEALKKHVPPLEMIKSGKGCVIVSHVDITAGLLGTNTLTILGYDAPMAQAIVWNLLGWANSG